MRVRVVDELPPEQVAMVQALYSRSPKPVEEHLAQVARKGSDDFMRSYYVGYNHKSIADCGSTTLFIEGVSLLAAKAIQDWPLYSGQETSTRYVDMARQPVVDPFDNETSRRIVYEWMAFYQRAQLPVQAHVRATYPRGEGEDEVVYERAVKARTFDITRGFLPAGITTQLSWHTNLRQAGDHLSTLRYHPSAEVREVAQQMMAALRERYPSSAIFLGGASGERAGSDELVEWNAMLGRDALQVEAVLWHQPAEVTLSLAGIRHRDITRSRLWKRVVERRPRGAVLPHSLLHYGTVTIDFGLDYGSFRDIQRHRNGACDVPLLATGDFEPWYLDSLPEGLKQEAEALVVRQRERIDPLASEDAVAAQHLCALGFCVPCRVTYGLPALAYVIELRSQRTVHPTLRRVALAMADAVDARLPGLLRHVDRSPSEWDVRRGKQTIVEKTA